MSFAKFFLTRTAATSTRSTILGAAFRAPAPSASASALTPLFARFYSSDPSSSSTKTLFVGNLAWTVRSEELGTLFAQFGEVKSARVLMDRDTGRSRGFGFIEIEGANAGDAIAKLNGQIFKGRELKVNEAEGPKPTGSRPPRSDRPPRGDRPPRRFNDRRGSSGDNEGGY
ncbi:hypothetical protein HDU76_012882 [Blyttiomyces sp. JEL0837]|nr:hypothetical protein HDU76_012882 [Blyttiomyces sp. JEL0837]